MKDSNDHGEDGEDAGGKEGEEEGERKKRRGRELKAQPAVVHLHYAAFIAEPDGNTDYFLNISNIVKLQKILEEFLLRLCDKSGMFTSVTLCHLSACPFSGPWALEQDKGWETVVCNDSEGRVLSRISLPFHRRLG